MGIKNNSLLEIISSRKSIRAYKKDKIEREKLNYILECFRLAPSAANKQPWKIILIENEKTKFELASACNNQKWISQAPLVIAVCSYPEESYKKIGGYINSHQIDISIAFEHLVLAAEEQGLGTCWIGAFDESKVKAILGVPENVNVLALTPLGYKAETGRNRIRKALNEIICKEKYC